MLIWEYILAHRVRTLLGTLLYLGGLAVIVWNEKRAVRNSLSLEEALADIVSIRYDEPFDPALNGQVVHVSGPLVTGEPLTEPDYNIQVLAVKLKRRVQMLQWIESTIEHTYGSTIDMVASPSEDSPTYYYSTEWRDELVASNFFYSRFSHENPPVFPFRSRIQLADHVHIGHFELGAEVKAHISNWVPFTSDSRPDDAAIKLHSGFYYHTNDVWEPEVGDVRVSFAFAGLEGSRYTVVGQLRDGRIEPYVSRFGRPVLLVHAGEQSAGEALRHAHYALKKTTWLARLYGVLFMFLAVSCCSELVALMFNQMPVLWTLAPDARYPIRSNLVVTFVMAIAITSLAWVWQRPWLGLGMMMAAVSPMLFFARTMVRYERVPPA